MEDNNYNPLHDPLINEFREKLRQHTLPVEPSVWKGLQSKLPVKKKTIPLWVAVSISIAAAVALLFTVGNVFYSTKENFVEDAMIVTAEKKGKNDIQSAEILNPKTDDVKDVEPQLVVAHHIVRTTKQKLVSNSDVAASLTGDVVSELKSENTDESSENMVMRIAEAGNAAEHQAAVESPSMGKQHTEIVSLINSSNDWTQDLLQKKTQQIQLAVGFGSGIAGISGFSRNNMLTDQSMNERFATLDNSNITNVMSPASFGSRNFLPPVTVGFYVRWPSEQTVSFESGIQYSYLQTRMFESIWSNANAQLHLHYIGVPLNMVCKLHRHGNWNIYASGGVTLEKGVWSDYRQQQHAGTTVFITSATAHIDGLQWSLNTALGISYRLSRDMSLYFDPR